jgi:hypothetical protein
MDEALKKMLEDILKGMDSFAEYKTKLEEETKKENEKDIDEKYDNDVYYKLAGVLTGVSLVAAAYLKMKGDKEK